MKVWVTKFALTKGIMEVDAREPKHFPDAVEVGEGILRQRFHKGEWHTTKQAAIEQAEKMRKARVLSLQKSLKKMEALKFDSDN